MKIKLEGTTQSIIVRTNSLQKEMNARDSDMRMNADFLESFVQTCTLHYCIICIG